MSVHYGFSPIYFHIDLCLFGNRLALLVLCLRGGVFMFLYVLRYIAKIKYEIFFTMCTAKRAV